MQLVLSANPGMTRPDAMKLIGVMWRGRADKNNKDEAEDSSLNGVVEKLGVIEL